MYCTIQSIKRRFPQFSETQWGSPPLPDDAELKSIIATADAMVDDYCREAYQVPFDPVPSTISEASLELCTVAPFGLRRLLFGMSPTNDEQVETRYKTVISQLEKIGKGLPPVLDAPRRTGPDASPGGVLYSMPDDKLLERDKVY